MSANLAHKLHEPHYWDGPDALNLLDLKEYEPKVETTAAAPVNAEASGPVSAQATVPIKAEATDSLRLFLQARIPAALLDPKGLTQRKLLGEDTEAGGRMYNFFPLFRPQSCI